MEKERKAKVNILCLNTEVMKKYRTTYDPVVVGDDIRLMDGRVMRIDTKSQLAKWLSEHDDTAYKFFNKVSKRCDKAVKVMK